MRVCKRIVFSDCFVSWFCLIFLSIVYFYQKLCGFYSVNRLSTQFHDRKFVMRRSVQSVQLNVSRNQFRSQHLELAKLFIYFVLYACSRFPQMILSPHNIVHTMLICSQQQHLRKMKPFFFIENEKNGGGRLNIWQQHSQLRVERTLQDIKLRIAKVHGSYILIMLLLVLWI